MRELSEKKSNVKSKAGCSEDEYAEASPSSNIVGGDCGSIYALESDNIFACSNNNTFAAEHQTGDFV